MLLPSHSSRRPVFAAPRQMASLPTVVLLLHQMVAGSEGHQVGVVSRGRNGDGPGAPDVGVAELVGQLLELVSIEMIIVPQNVVVAGPRCALDTCNQVVIISPQNRAEGGGTFINIF